MITIFQDTNFDFQGKRHIALVVSGLLILASLVSLVLHGGPNYGIDFEGGLSLLIRSTHPEGAEPITESAVRSTLATLEMSNSEVKMSRSAEGEDLQIKIEEEGRYRPPEALIRSAIEQELGDNWRLVQEDELAQAELPDLQGLSRVVISTEENVDKLKQVLSNAEIDNPRVIEHVTQSGGKVYILTGEGRDSISRLYKALVNDFPGYKFEIRSIDRVGPRIGEELRIRALLAIFAALALIVIYLWWRFEFLFGVAAVVALFHDVMITLGIFSVLNLEISVIIIGAFLTLVGYSLNDTIVVFDRIRENLKRYKNKSYAEVINISINATISRTIITSGTTMMVVLVIFFAGGEVLHSFSLALLVGIIVGTYSSIYIASPILVEWANRTGKAAGAKQKSK